MEPSSPGRTTEGFYEREDPATEQLPLTASDQRGAAPNGSRRRKAPWVIATIAVLLAAGVAVAVVNPFGSGGAGGPGVAQGSDPTGTYTVARQDLFSQTQVSATIGYAGSYTIAAPSGASSQEVSQAQQAVTADQQTLSADQQTDSDKATSDNDAVAAAQTNVSADQSGLSSDETTETQACAGSGASSAACSSATQKVNQDQTQLTQAGQQLTAAQSSATLDHDQAQAQVQAEETKLQDDQSTLSSLQATEVNPGTTYTSLPSVGDVIKQDQPVYSVSNAPVPLLYGTVPAYRAFYVGMSDGADVGELTADLIALGCGTGLTQSNHYSTATAAAVERWQSALGVPTTGTILLGQVVFEPGPIRITSVTPSVGEAVAAGGGAGGASSSGSGTGGGSGGGAAVLTATSTSRQVSIALDASDQSDVAVGDKVSITLPNNQTTPGVISSVGTVAVTPSSSASNSSGSSSPTITVLVNPTNPADTGNWDQAPVTVTITTGSVTDALVVPVNALRAQPGGSYAVEVANANGSDHLVVVHLGLFDDAAGLVQVTDTTLAVGQRVVVPKL